MIDKRTICQEALGGLAEDFLDVFLTPLQPFPDNISYPSTPSVATLVRDQFNSLELPERRLVRLEQVIGDDWSEQDERKLADLIAIFECEILSGFGYGVSILEGTSFQGLRRLASSWGSYLTQVLGRVATKWEFSELFGDIMATLSRQLRFSDQIGRRLGVNRPPSRSKPATPG